jgi:hypothetical protein
MPHLKQVWMGFQKKVNASTYVSKAPLKKNLIWYESKFLKWNSKMRKDIFWTYEWT